MKLSLSSLAAIAIVGIAASTLPNAAGHLRSIPPPSLVEEDNAHSYGKGATAPLTKGTEEVNHNRVGRKLQKQKKKKKDKKKNKKVSSSILSYTFSFANDIILLTYVSSLISSIYIDIIGKLSLSST